MKIESPHQTPASLTGPGCDTCQSKNTGGKNETIAKALERSVQDSFDSSAGKRLASTSGVEDGKAIYRMSELRKKADEQLAAQDHVSLSGESVTSVETIRESHGELDRAERVEIAKLRVNSGFYTRDEVIDEISRRIADSI